MEKIKITLVDGSEYSKFFETSSLRDQFVAKLELFEGLFIDFFTQEKIVKINPNYIIKIEVCSDLNLI
ncbi:MAG: hypothetical protein FJZ59_00295 [Chlamydiae bacterium]|jgi:hypothetical protein|nr:hypothetical protein [Chlamydiota bacterium]